LLNNRPICVSTIQRLEDSLPCTGFPSRNRSQSVNIEFFCQLAMATHGVRRTGSPRPRRSSSAPGHPGKDGAKREIESLTISTEAKIFEFHTTLA
jgi:hypothetical protein